MKNLISINDVFLTPHFKLREFQSPDTKEVILHRELVKRLQRVRNEIKKPIIITSGYRTEKHNFLVGGELNSQHRVGCAVDISTVNHDIRKLKSCLKNEGFKQIIVYRYDKIVHVALFKKNPF